PTNNPTGGPVRTGLPGTAVRVPSPGTDAITGIVNNDGNQVKAAELLAREKART
ncbi:hypothetical protein QBC32DRAFT_199695, partial [Pseudoneurospora amorphoporcata]